MPACCLFSCVWLIVTPRTVEEAPVSMGFSRQEYRSGLPFPPPGDISDPGTETSSLPSLSLAGGFFTTSATWGAPNFQRCLLPPIPLAISLVQKPLHPRPILLWQSPQFLPLSIHLAQYYRLVILKQCQNTTRDFLKLWLRVLYNIKYKQFDSSHITGSPEAGFSWYR